MLILVLRLVDVLILALVGPLRILKNLLEIYLLIVFPLNLDSFLNLEFTLIDDVDVVRWITLSIDVTLTNAVDLLEVVGVGL